MIRKMICLFGLMLVGVPASFASIILVNTGAADTIFQQNFNSPCVIGDNSCKQPSVDKLQFDFTKIAGTPDTSWNGSLTTPSFSSTPGEYNLTSPAGDLVAGALPNTPPHPINISFDADNNPYIVGAVVEPIADQIPNSFTIGIDVNFADTQEALVAFNTWVSHAGGTFAIDSNNSWQLGPALLAEHNGNGYSDAILTGFNLTQGDLVFFQAIYGAPSSDIGTDKDGMEEFFLIPAGTPPSPIPEPASLLLLGTGLAGIGLAAWRRKK